MTCALIVDDNTTNLAMLRALLQGHGLEVHEARNGVEALTTARQHPPDVVISDLLMPVMDGYTLVCHWRADPRLQRIPFLVYTATYTEPKDERLAKALGADAFMIKPAEPEMLMALVREVLAQAHDGTLASASTLGFDDLVLLKQYNEVLVRKLEQKIVETDTINRALREEIVQRRSAEAEARESEERFRTTFEQVAVGIAYYDRSGRLLRVNDKFCDMTAYSREELLGMTFLELTAPEDRAESEAARLAILAGRQTVYSAEKQYLTKNGTTFWCHVNSTLIKEAADTPEYFVSVLTDIMERKRSELALRLRDRAIQSVSQGIIITELGRNDNPIIYASAGFERITGYRAEEVLGRDCRFLQGAETDANTVARMREAIARREACEVEIVNYRKDGSTFWNALSLNPVIDDSGAVGHYVGVQIDTSERKLLEQLLQQSQKMEAVGQLAGGVAHDFNNLLTVISGNAGLVLDMPDVNGMVRDCVADIRAASERAAGLTQRLLGFSRRSILQPKVLDLNAAVTESMTLLRRLIGEEIELTTVLGADLNPVKVDPAQLDQVLLNLAVNARDAMPKGGRLTIETANVSLSDDYAATHLDAKSGPHVLLAMTDTGCGMPREIMDRIFEPFFTTKEVGKGTGLGLSMVLGIVQQSGGCINVYSEPGRGTSFKIYLPVVAEHFSPKKDVQSLPDPRGTETVLVVEDEKGVRDFAVTSLRQLGYQAEAACDSEEALGLLQARGGRFDLVITDVVMPKLSGPQLVEALRKRIPDVRVLYMSGYTDDTVVRHGLLEAEVAFLQKPFSVQELARKVREVLASDRTESR